MKVGFLHAHRLFLNVMCREIWRGKHWQDWDDHATVFVEDGRGSKEFIMRLPGHLLSSQTFRGYAFVYLLTLLLLRSVRTLQVITISIVRGRDPASGSYQGC